MSTELRERLSQAVGPVGSGPDVEGTLRRGNTLRRRRRIQASIGSLCAALIMVGGAAIVVQEVPGPELGPIGGGDDAAAVLHDAAASDPALWPLRVVYELHYPVGYFASHDPGGVARYEFVGTSWNNWQVTQVFGPGARAGEIVDRVDRSIDQYARDGEDTAESTRAPSRDLHPGWHEPGWSLQQVDLDAVPTSEDVLDQLGFAPSDVRAFVSSGVVDCGQNAIEHCSETGREGVRALMHAESGLLLYRETAYEGEPSFTYVVTELDFSDADAIPEHDR